MKNWLFGIEEWPPHNRVAETQKSIEVINVADQFGWESTTEQVLAGIDLTGKTIVVTGGSAGLGVETGRALCAAGADLVMVGRDAGKMAAAKDVVVGARAGASVSSYLMDLANLESVREAGSKIAAKHPRVDVLVNNAGVMACPFLKTDDGFEMQFGTNHIGHFEFTRQLLPSLTTSGARVVNLSSAGHKYSDIVFDDIHFAHRDYDKWSSYGQSKTANMLFSVELTRRYAAQGIYSNAVHPGVIMTDLSRHLTEEDIAAMASRRKSSDAKGEDKPADRPSSSGMKLKSLEQGAATSVWAATSDVFEQRGGLYLENCQIGEPERDNMGIGYKPYAVDTETAARLWEVSEQLTGSTWG